MGLGQVIIILGKLYHSKDKLMILQGRYKLNQYCPEDLRIVKKRVKRTSKKTCKKREKRTSKKHVRKE